MAERNTGRYGSAYNKSWPGNNLGELIAFLKTTEPGGLSLRKLAERLGVTQACISNTFCRDDMKLKRAEDICRAYGYRLSLYFPTEYYGFNEGFEKKEYKDKYPNAGNLSGLVKYIMESGFSPSYVAHGMNMSPGVLIKAFTTGDISIKTLYLCADSLKIEIEWRFEKEDKTN